MLERLLHWVERYADHKHATKALSFVSFVESSFFPIPPFVLIIAMLAHERRISWIRLAVIGTLASVCGGVFGYFIGKFFYMYIGAPLVAFYGLGSEVTYLGTLFRAHVFATILLASISPVPYKVFTISAGLFSVNLWSFIIASILGRGLRFFTVSYIANRYGINAKRLLLTHQKNVFTILVIILVLLIAYSIL